MIPVLVISNIPLFFKFDKTRDNILNVSVSGEMEKGK